MCGSGCQVITSAMTTGNTTTLAHYFELLEGAGMARGLPKFAGALTRVELDVLDRAT